MTTEILQQYDTDYHADYSRWSQSMLKDFRFRRRVAEARYVRKTIGPRTPTAAMQRGTLTHMAVLHPENLSKGYAVYPPSVLAKNGAASTNEAKAFKAEHEAAGRIVMQAEAFENVLGMASSVKSVCARWLKLVSRRAEVIRWMHAATGLPLKMKFDWLIEGKESMICFDLKTTDDSSPRAFGQQIENLSYWMQDAHYREGIGEAFGKPVEFYFVAVESEWPYTCVIHSLDEASQGSAASTRLKTLQDVKACVDSGNWAETWEGGISPISLSLWFAEK